jgi:hypothetical protein
MHGFGPPESGLVENRWGNHMVNANIAARDDMVATKFIGVYSGRRLARDRSDTQLDMVWPESYIAEIIIGAKRDE